jgi:hypothetical protein
MYKVIDVAKMFSVSKVTIYKKISAKKNLLKGHIIKKKNITYLDDEAVEIIKNSLQINQEKASGRLIDEELNQTYLDLRSYKEQNEKLKAEKIAILNDQLLDLESTVRYLNGQLALKKNYLKKQEEVLFDINEAVKHQKYVINQLESFISAQDLEGKY